MLLSESNVCLYVYVSFSSSLCFIPLAEYVYLLLLSYKQTTSMILILQTVYKCWNHERVFQLHPESVYKQLIME